MTQKYWDYFLSIEGDLNQCTKYVEFHYDNFNTFSIEFAKILVMASAEFENVAKDICSTLGPNQAHENINNIKNTILAHYPNFASIKVSIPRYKIEVFPWDNWNNNLNPDWWSQGYNKIKHSRNEYFQNANLGSVIHSMVGLFTSIILYHQIHYGSLEVEKSYESSLFSIPNQDLGTGIEDVKIINSYKLPV